MANFKIGVDFAGNLGNLPQQAAAAAAALGKVGDAAEVAGADLNQFANVSEHAFDEVAAGAAAMDRITASIGKMVGAALSGGDALDNYAQSAVKAITPLNALEARLDQIGQAMTRAGTVQGAANLAVQYDILNRTLEDTKRQINQVASAGIGLSRAFATVSTASGSLNRLAPAVKPVLTNLKLVPPAANAAAASLQKMRGAGGQASAALTDFSRVIQDAPFGIVGIGNNITQLVESFGRLKAASGSTGGALKSMVGAITGPGGLGLAISLITTLATFAAVGFGAWTRGLGDNKSKVDENKEALQEFIENLKSVGEITDQARGSVQGQAAEVQALAKVVQDTNRSYEDRKRALEELSQINKSYFGDLKLEENQLSILAQRVNEYTDALVAQAVLKGFTEEISKIAPELAKQERALSAAQDRLNRARTAYSSAADAAQKYRSATTATGGSGLGGAISQTDTYTRQLSKASGELNDSERAFREQRTAVETLATSLVVLKGQIKGAVDATIGLRDLTSSSTDKQKKETDALKERIAALKELGRTEAQTLELAGLEIQLINRDALKEGFKKEELDNLIENVLEEYYPGRNVFLKLKGVPEIEIQPAKLEVNIDVAGAVGPAEGQQINFVNKFKDKILADIEKAREDLGKSIKDLKLDAAVQSVEVLGTAIGDALSGGSFREVLQTAAQSLLGILGSTLVEIGKQIIKTSVLVEGLKKALNGIFGPGGTTIAAGVGFALVGLGSIMKAIKIPAFATGVTNFKGGAALVGENGPEIITMQQGANVIPNHLIGTGGGAQEMFWRLRGEDLLLATQRAHGRRSRM